VIKFVAFIVVMTMVTVTYVVSGFNRSIESPPRGGHYVRAEADILYGANCAGCHGADGAGGAARGLTDPVFLRIADDTTIRDAVARGVPRTEMPAFAKTAGGALTDDQIGTIVRSLRSRGGNAARADDTDPPPYAVSVSGDPVRGGDAFARFCSKCHGDDGRGGPSAGSIVDPAYLALESDQSLRTTIIAGRPDLGAPDWRGNVPGRPMSAQEVSDVVAWLTARRMP
jgi:cytochrome c oxidase cbb3-type subunit 3